LPLILLSVLLTASCGSNLSEVDQQMPAQAIPPSALENRFDEVRAIHDEVMPERTRIIRLQRGVVNGDLDEELSAFAKTRLERADDMMMNWMYADIPLSTLVDSLEEDPIYSYLDVREKEIKQVSDSMMAAIHFAESILAQ